ncbi:MAG TPA: hypothetical protein PLI96_03625 [Halothiobacillus sp.]|nr:hypothetical protein [Halothiobacillus sp.]
MATSVLRFLPWSVPAKTQPQRPAELIAEFADLMHFYRAELPSFRPAQYARIQQQTPAQAAQMDGLISALLILDGLLTARAELMAQRPARLPQAELADYKVTPEHFTQQTVDFAWRRLCERYVRRSRDLLQASAPLGKPWLRGMPYRLSIARAEQVLRQIQVDPAVAYQGATKRAWVDELTASARIAWRTLTGRR